MIRRRRSTSLPIVAAASAAVALAHLLASGCGSSRRPEPLVGPMRLTETQQLGRQVFSQHCYQCHVNGSGGVGPAPAWRLICFSGIRFATTGAGLYTTVHLIALL